MQFSSFIQRHMWLMLFFVFELCSISGHFVGAQQNNQDIVISEIMSSNSATIADEDGDYPDWIELYNKGAESVNLEGWSLSDDENDLYQWVFPKTELNPGEYLIIWASNKDRRPDSEERTVGIIREVFWGISGTSVDDLLAYSGFPSKPDYSSIVAGLFEAPVDIDDNYGQRMHGLLKAPQSGYYIFGIAGDDNSRLFLSSDETHQNSALIAEVPGWTNGREWDKYNEQQSDEIYLEEDKMYYISALMKEASGGDNLAVRWEMPDGTVETPMNASHVFSTGRELHTNFAISSAGEPIILANAEGEIIQQTEPLEISTDISYGIAEDMEDYVYFSDPTPGSAGIGGGYIGITDQAPVFSHSGGFYTASFELTLSTDDPDAEIYYTLDGSVPEEANTGGETYNYVTSYPSGQFQTRETITYKYEDPVAISNSSAAPDELAVINTTFSSSAHQPVNNIFKGTVVRAKVVKENTMTVDSETHTFFVTPEGTSRYDLPVVSIVTNEYGLFGYDEGIYVPGKFADEWYADNPESDWNDGRPANYNQRGSEWEKPAHLEYFDESPSASLRQNIGVRVHGGWSRAYKMKSLRLYARNSYDEENSFNYPFFGDLPARGNPDEKVKSFRRLILRNSGNDNFNTMFRDALMQDLVKHLPFSVQAYQPVIHFINGEYWGIINIRERFDEDYIASHFNMDPDDVSILGAWGSVDEGKPGDRDLFFEIVDYAESHNLSGNQYYEWVEKRIDIESLAHYYAVQIYFYNTDWPQNNMTFWRKRTINDYDNAPHGHDGRWRWMLYDTDFGMNLYGAHDHSINGLSRVMNEASDPSSRLFRELMQNDIFRERFINITADHLNSCFNSAYINTRIDSFNAILASSRDEHWNRWQEGTDNVEALKRFANQRPGYILDYTSDQFDLNGTASLTILREDDGGLVRVNSIDIDKDFPGISSDISPYPWQGVYFKDVPVVLRGVDTPGYRFSHWEGIGDANVTDRETNVMLSESMTIKAVFEESERALIHYWHFNYLPDGNLASQTPNTSLTEETAVLSYEGEGEGYMDRVSDGSDINARDGVSGERALRVRNPADTRELLFKLPTTGFEDIVMSYAVKRTSKGAQVQGIYFRTEANGGWMPFRENIQINEDYHLVEIDFSEIKEVNDNAHFMVKITFPHESSSGTSGNNRFDNVTLEGYNIERSNITDDGADFRFRIFPIPASNSISVESQYKINELRIYDINGKEVKKERPAALQHKININMLRKGVYFMEIQTLGGSARQKIVVN